MLDNRYIDMHRRENYSYARTDTIIITTITTTIAIAPLMLTSSGSTQKRGSEEEKHMARGHG